MILRRFAVPVLAAVLGAGLAASAAPPAFADSCTLFIGNQTPQHFYPVSVSCGRDTVQGFSLWGQDEVFDEFRQGFNGVSSASVSRDVLNEDDSIFNREDDIYAKVGGVDVFGNSFNDRMTNVIHRNF
ncbi:hypothetical protein [Nonomuraea sediminis]|uniref:hypothetical protein n=1 Tax=Nonomuraea sediminis TaxID=2835864 RepID=UPI001BDDBC9E|nr:hypothetical protein [Nonomuraea sediminis]